MPRFAIATSDGRPFAIAFEHANGRYVDPAVKRWPKTCGCGETWSREHWGELTPVGRYQADEWIELRSCVCGKTLAVPTSELDDAAP